MGAFAQKVAGGRQSFAARVAAMTPAPEPTALERGAEGIQGAIPGLQSLKEFNQGGSPWNTSPEGIGRAVGDVSGVALAGIMGPRALASAAGLGAVVEGSGLGPASRKAGAAGEEFLNERLATQAPSKLAGIEGLGTAANFASQIPGAVSDIAGKVLPYALGGKLAAKTGVMGSGEAPQAPKPQAPTLPQQLEALGGQVTPAMRGGKFSKALETSARTNPLMMNKYGKIDASMAEAVRKLGEQHFGKDFITSSAADTGATMKGLLSELAKKRASEYTPAIEAVEKAKGFTRLGKEVLGAADEAAKAEGVLPSVLKLWKQNTKGLAKANTPKAMDLEMRDLRQKFASQYDQLKKSNASVYGDAERSFKVLQDAAKNKFYEILDRNAPGENLGQKFREAKADYAEASEGMSPLTKALQSRRGKPEAIGSTVLGTGSEGVKGLIETAGPELQGQIKVALAKSILKDARGNEGGISGPKLKSLLMGKYKDVAPLLGEEFNKLKDLSKGIEISKLAELQTVNPSGSGSLGATVGHSLAAGGAMFNPAMLKALAGKTVLDTAYTYGAPALQKAGAALKPMALDINKARARALRFAGAPVGR